MFNYNLSNIVHILSNFEYNVSIILFAYRCIEQNIFKDITQHNILYINMINDYNVSIF